MKTRDDPFGFDLSDQEWIGTGSPATLQGKPVAGSHRRTTGGPFDPLGGETDADEPTPAGERDDL